MRILVFGATGMLGHKVWQSLRARFPDTFCTIRGSRAELARFGLFDTDKVVEGLDVGDYASVHRVLEDLRPDAIINCVAITKRRGESGDALASIELNAALPHRLAHWADARSARLIHFSTDCVFDGRDGGYNEDSPTSAEDLYGRTKALGEVDLRSALTIRTSLVGRELKGKTELLEWFLAQRGKRIRGYCKAMYTGVSTVWMAGLIADILARFPSLSGIYQVAAPVVSKYELLLLARDAFDIDVEIDPDDSVVIRRNLDGSRFSRATGIEVPHWQQMMHALAQDPTPYDQWSDDAV
jgi:dTDP-4-dehydrorhamnose reductase